VYTNRFFPPLRGCGGKKKENLELREVSVSKILHIAGSISLGMVQSFNVGFSGNYSTGIFILQTNDN
jgi:hypothetical protein